MLANLTCVEFLDKLASNEPVPGGGSVAALTGGIAAALAAMVANLTVGKKNYVEVSEEMEEIATRMIQMKIAFVEFIDKDANSFDGVMKAFKLPKETDEEKAARTAAIQNGYKEAIAVPLAVAKAASEMFEMIEVVVTKGNQNAVTDGLVAAMSARTAILGALLNVKINLSSVKDEAYVEKIKSEVEALEAFAIKREGEILAKAAF
ncbi:MULTISPECIES: cyclodeaminase/cyclohydrolase family protein [unclassified Fusibacter]|uniref:cyclodeaminase/cyclohydrolase family protein n=1 Tax=unclassified Fusibacter TaxID=2624464 RepID=UPI0010111B98|nr:MULTISPECIES: cyclodeaminase/cyclohydrolase family protein [unclassified Fusibacter]MCK8060778.1 cyclodeaminase/cyclohydrolase family protein [Fusibacter sp. A2]NPE23074.1 cyclodeaminase/cyclohydrolase family protein [Fusibacter sp. A1]RXV59744.1 methenyltetrahydrofolate cyclohydrolase [Fusibacter sp. A1]